MVEYDVKLNNFCVVVPVVVKKNVSVPKRFYVTANGIFTELSPVCSECFSRDVVRNGWHRCEAKVVKELGLDVKEGQYCCNRCGFSWSVSCEDIGLFLVQYKEIIRNVVFDLYCKNVSLGKIVAHVRDCWCRNISREWVRQVYIEIAELVEHDKVLVTSGIFHYDEQYTSQGLRIALKDSITKKVIFEKLFDDKKKETIITALNTALRPYNKVVLIADMDSKYPAVLKELYGDKVEIQWCIFHLNKLIVKEFKESYKNGIPLEQLLNMYEMLNIFFNHQPEMNFLRQELRKLEHRRKLLQKSSCSEKEKNEKLKEYEKTLKKEFTEYRTSLKKNRRRKNGIKLKTRTLDSAEYFLNRIEKFLKAFFPKKLKERVKYIRKNWNKFTTFYHHESVPPTNNGIEQYFSATLQKTQKKRFRNKKTAQLKFNICKALNNGTRIIKPINIFTLILLFTKITKLFLTT